MEKMSLKTATIHDLEWINTKYREVDFVPSNYNNEHILIAHVSKKEAGLGRLVKIDANNTELGGIYVFPEFRGQHVADCIVTGLCNQNPFKNTTIWCLPFENLVPFYMRFGFTPHTNGQIPTEIAKKLEWCNAPNRYKQRVILLHKQA